MGPLWCLLFAISVLTGCVTTACGPCRGRGSPAAMTPRPVSMRACVPLIVGGEMPVLSVLGRADFVCKRPQLRRSCPSPVILEGQGFAQTRKKCRKRQPETTAEQAWTSGNMAFILLYTLQAQPGKQRRIPLELIEAQTGSHLGENAIVRSSDDSPDPLSP